MFHLENITISAKKKNILKNFNLNINSGNKILIAGKSGIGKSTVINLLLGFREPDSGTIYYQGEKYTKKVVLQLRQKVGFVSQDVDIGEGIVIDFICNIFRYKANQHLQFEENQLKELVTIFDLENDVLEKDLQELSGGERQRVAIIIAILLQRKIYLLDEPTSALDKKSKEKVFKYFLNRKDLTVVFITHEMEIQENDNVEVVNLQG
jgi:putative ABC transport system ATP-binding protein